MSIQSEPATWPRNTPGGPAPAAAPTASVIFRPMVPTDRGFVSSKWLRSFKGAPTVRGVSQQTFFYFQHKIMAHLVARSRVVIACNREDPDHLYGFACFEQDGPTVVLHYLFVRKGLRGQRVGTAILREVLRSAEAPVAALVWTHRTRGGIDAWLHRFATEQRLASLYNPYLINPVPEPEKEPEE